MLASLLAATLLAAPAPAVPAPDSTFRFVVLGHIRGGVEGDLSPRLAELLERVRELKPQAVVLPGDIIWGEVQTVPVDSARIEAQWNAVDSALATLGVPVIRAPGNHDINDPVTRDAWFRRYGPLPLVTRVGPVRFISVSSAWIPKAGDSVSARRAFIRGVALTPDQVAFLRDSLPAAGGARQTFLVMHHLLWWEADTTAFWREVHPLLRDAHVSGVFSGDYGPLKFSWLQRDGVHYYQNSIELPVKLPLLQNNLGSRLLSSQFDNYLEVRVTGDSVRYLVHTVAEESSGEFTPSRWRDINQPARPAPTLLDRVLEKTGGKRRLAYALALAGAAFFVGVVLGRRRR